MILKEIIDSMPALTELKANKDILVKTSFEISLLIKKIDGILKTFEESRKELFEKYGEKNQDGSINILKENISILENALKEVLEVDVSFEYTPIKLNDLGDIKISPDALYRLSWLIKE